MCFYGNYFNSKYNKLIHKKINFCNYFDDKLKNNILKINLYKNKLDKITYLFNHVNIGKTFLYVNNFFNITDLTIYLEENDINYQYFNLNKDDYISQYYEMYFDTIQTSPYKIYIFDNTVNINMYLSLVTNLIIYDKIDCIHKYKEILFYNNQKKNIYLFNDDNKVENEINQYYNISIKNI